MPSSGAAKLPVAAPGGQLKDDFGSLALSPDGRYLAGNLFVPDHRDELSVIDLQTRTGWFLKGDKPGFLCQPAFSPDGRSLAMVWLPPLIASDGRGAVQTLYYSRSEIWVTGLHGGLGRTFGDPDRIYQYPSFSPDSQRLVMFRDGYQKPPPYHNFDWTYVSNPADNVLYELDLATGRGHLMNDIHFVGVLKAAYDPFGRGIFLNVTTELEVNPKLSLKYATSMSWKSPAGDFAALNWLWRYGQPLPPDWPPFAPPTIVGKAAAFEGVTSSGTVLLRASTPAPAGTPSPSSFVELYDGKSARRLLEIATLKGGVGGSTVSFDGRTVVTSGIDVGAPLVEHVDNKWKFLRVIDVPSGQIHSHRLGSYDFKAVQPIISSTTVQS